MDTKWKRSRAVCGFFAFVVGLSMILEGLLFFGVSLSSRSGRQWLADSFRDDWRNTQEFRDFVSVRLETLITMGAGGRISNVYYYGVYGDGRGSNRAYELHKRWEQDKNVLYYVAAEGEVKYTNDETLSGATAGTLADGYSFFLQFDGEKARIWMDGEELDLYGSGWYDYEGTGQWYIPGYDNFILDDKAAGVRVTMAVMDEPRVFIQGNYADGETEQYSELYYLKQNLEECRKDAVGHAIRLGAGLALMAGYALLRRDKKRADQAIGRCTGRVWFEVKVVLLLLLVYVSIPRTTYLYDVWSELTIGCGTMSGGSAADINGDIIAELEQQFLSQEEIEAILTEYSYPIQQTTSFGTAAAILSENGGWLLKELLVELASRRANLLILFWGFYLLLFNDWRYNKQPWLCGIGGMLTARELEYPIQKRLVRRAALPLALCCLWLFCMVLFFWVFREGIGRVAVWVALLLSSAALLLVLVLSAHRTGRLARELGALADQAASVRGGCLDQPLKLPKDADLGQLADDLNHIRQGLHQAVEERTRSEQMKVALITNVSHDLKTPLTSIISYTELLAQEPLEPPASEYVQILGEKSQRLKAMVQDVFEISKAASGQLPVKLDRLDFARLLRQTLADMAQAIRDSGLSLRASIPEGAVPIIADSDRMYRVFQNLLGNALKYSIPGSRVYLTLSVEGAQAAALLQNTSDAELRPGADYTGRFVRGDESRTDGGSGLGLSIAQSFTQACGGVLEVATQADLFTVRVAFPLDREG